MTRRPRRDELYAWALWALAVLLCAVAWLLIVVGAVTLLDR